MNRKEAAELLPIIQAFAEGRTIERKPEVGNLIKVGVMKHNGRRQKN